MSHHHFRSGGKRKSRDRKFDRLDPAQRFLIVCEGERTEPNYFNAFRILKEVCEIDIHGDGYNTVSLVRQAIELARAANEVYDQVWCVFDKDSFSMESFNEACTLAYREGFHVAYSNEAFELWYLLHFHYYNTGISRRQYCRLLDKQLNRKYLKKDPDIYELLRSRQGAAIRNARNLLATYEPRNPARDNPSTTVFELVETLNTFLVENRMKVLANRSDH